MMTSITPDMIFERVENRILGALAFTDATTGQRIREPLRVFAPGLVLRRNLSGLTVIVSATGLADHNAAFLAPPADPLVGNARFEGIVEDPQRRYLARRFLVRLPRNPDPASANAIVKPLEITLYPAPTAQVGVRWAVVRAHVQSVPPTPPAPPTEAQPLPGALIRVLRTSDGAILARGFSDERGEALIAVEGIPVITWADGEDAVVSSELDVGIETFHDPNMAYPPDPDDLETRLDDLVSSRMDTRIASGRTVRVTFNVATP